MYSGREEAGGIWLDEDSIMHYTASTEVILVGPTFYNSSSEIDQKGTINRTPLV